MINKLKMCMCFQHVRIYAEFAAQETKLNMIHVPILRGWVGRLKLVKMSQISMSLLGKVGRWSL